MQTTPAHFLLAEDDDDHAELVLRSLTRHRVTNTVDRVADGEEVMLYLRHAGIYAGKKRPDVLLLDLNMPRMNGHDVLRLMKEDMVLRKIPVVILTTSDAETDRIKAYDLHANSYLVKPVDFTQFSKMVDDLSLYWSVWNRPAEE